MTDDRKLIEDAAKLACFAFQEVIGSAGYKIRGSGGYVTKDAFEQRAWENIATAMRTFWASHAEPEMGLVDALRFCADNIEINTIERDLLRHRMRAEADRLDADSQQRERDIAIGRAIAEEAKRMYGVNETWEESFASLARFARDQEANS